MRNLSLDRTKRRLAMEAVEKRELMAADVVGSDALVVTPQGNVELPDAGVSNLGELLTAEVSNGLATRLEDLSSQYAVGPVAGAVDVWEHAHLTSDAVDTVFSNQTGSDELDEGQSVDEAPQVSSQVQEQFKQMIHQALDDLAERLKVYWQLPEGQGPRVA